MKTILIDLDGVLNEYEGGFEPDFIPKPKENVEEFLQKLNKDFELRLFTTRNKLLASKWLIEYNLDKYFTDITDRKELCWLFIDDRCIKFDGEFERLISQVKGFKPWYK